MAGHLIPNIFYFLQLSHPTCFSNTILSAFVSNYIIKNICFRLVNLLYFKAHGDLPHENKNTRDISPKIFRLSLYANREDGKVCRGMIQASIFAPYASV